MSLIKYESETRAQTLRRLMDENTGLFDTAKTSKDFERAGKARVKLIYDIDNQGIAKGTVACRRRIIFAEGMIGQVVFPLPPRRERFAVDTRHRAPSH